MWPTEHTSEEIQEGGKKGQSRWELSERLEVGRPEMFGGFSSEHFWIDGLRLRAATRATARKRPCRSRALRVDLLKLLSIDGGETGGGS